MSEIFFKREVLLVFPDARVVASKGGEWFRVTSARAGYALSGFHADPKEAWADACAELPKGKALRAAGEAGIEAGQGDLFWQQEGVCRDR